MGLLREKYRRVAAFMTHITPSRFTDRITLIDTCSLLEYPGSGLFLRYELPRLINSGEKVIVPLVVAKELDRLSKQDTRPEIAERAGKALLAVAKLRESGVISIYGDDNDGTFADNVFQKVITILGRRYQITVITQERDLAQDILAMGHMASVKRKTIRVKKITREGKLINVEWKGASS